MEGASSSIVMLVVLLAFIFPLHKLTRAVIDWLNRH